MSVTTEHLGGRGYAPLPQSISNTDTEDEDEHLSNSTKVVHNGMEEMTTQDSNLIIENGRFYPLDETRNLANRARNGRSTLGYCSDDFPIMVVDGDGHDDLWKRRDMTPLRRFCLVISILLCLATILIFLYVLPCDNSMTCLPVPESQPSLSWDRSLQGVELHGRVSIVPGTPYSLIFLLRGQRYGPADYSEVKKNGGAVLSLDGNSGQVLWWVKNLKVPTDINCTALDVNASGKPDCLVAGEQGLLISIEPIAGTVYWSSEVNTYSKLPVLLPDVDSDGTNDLLSVEIINGQSMAFVLLSGRKGHLLQRHVPLGCPFIDIYSLDSNSDVSYLCHDSNGTESVKVISLKELLKNDNSSVHGRLTFTTKATPNPAMTSNRNFENYSWDLTPFHRLTIQNRGVCPGEDCEASVNLALQKDRTDSRLIWNHTAPNSYAMEPANMTTTGRPFVTGFAIKFWQWTVTDSATQQDGVYGSLVQRRVIERVLVVLMNQTDVHTLNASQSEVLQLCNGTDCQPSKQLQTRSVAIADLNGDGSRELISYRTTYDSESVQLSSTVQVVRLDAEVAKLSQPDFE